MDRMEDICDMMKLQDSPETVCSVGGEWLDAARSYIERIPDGDRLEFGSSSPIIVTMRDLERVAAEAVLADRRCTTPCSITRSAEDTLESKALMVIESRISGVLAELEATDVSDWDSSEYAADTLLRLFKLRNHLKNGDDL